MATSRPEVAERIAQAAEEVDRGALIYASDLELHGWAEETGWLEAEVARLTTMLDTACDSGVALMDMVCELEAERTILLRLLMENGQDCPQGMYCKMRSRIKCRACWEFWLRVAVMEAKRDGGEEEKP